MKNIRVPSKTFLTGEYSVLTGHRALVMTHEPFFTCSVDESATGHPKAIEFHAESPAGKLELELSSKTHKWFFDDPHDGSGGFGGSTAEFISVYKTLKSDGDLSDLKERYFSLFKKSAHAPSGADLVAQFNQIPSCVVYTKAPFRVETERWPFRNLSVMILKTERKLATHKHLESLEGLDFTELGKCSDLVVDAFLNRKEASFIEAVNRFSSVQADLKLLDSKSEKTAKLISKIYGVKAVRGCGAMGADVIAVFVKKDSEDYVWKRIETLAQKLTRVL